MGPYQTTAKLFPIFKDQTSLSERALKARAPLNACVIAESDRGVGLRHSMSDDFVMCETTERGRQCNEREREQCCAMPVSYAHPIYTTTLQCEIEVHTAHSLLQFILSGSPLEITFGLQAS